MTLAADLRPNDTAEARFLDREQTRFFEDEGYLILPGFFEPSEVAELKAHVDTLWSRRHEAGLVTIDGHVEDDGIRRNRRAYFRDADEETRRQVYKLNDLHLVDRLVQRFAVDRRLVAALGQLLQSPPIVCNTLLFERGSTQNAHFDTFYMPSKTPNKMAATWIAIDPVTDSNGPLFYYPRSHRIEPFRFSSGGLQAIDAEMPQARAHIDRIIREFGLRETRFLPQPGDVLIWHAQLLHGGSPIRDMGATRASLVTHYWTALDFPDPAQRIDVGQGQYMLDKPHQLVASRTARADIAAYLRDLDVTPEQRAAMPPGFDAAAYLLRNLDLFEVRAHPYDHYHRFGRHEGRVW